MSIFFNANSITFMSEDVIKFMEKWTNKGHPSDKYQSAKDCKKIIVKYGNNQINNTKKI